MVLGEARRPLPCTHGSRREGRAAAADNVSTRGTAETRLRAKSWPDPPWAGGYSVSLLGGSPDPPWAGRCSISLSGGSPDPPWAGRCSISLLGRSPDLPWAGGCSISLVGAGALEWRVQLGWRVQHFTPGYSRVGALTPPGQEGAAFPSRVGALSRPGLEGAAFHSRVRALTRPGLEGAAFHSRVGAPGALRTDRDGRVLGRSAPRSPAPRQRHSPCRAVASAQREVQDEHSGGDAALGCLVGPWTPTRAAQIFTEHGGLAGFSGRLLWGRACSHGQQSLSKPYPQLLLQQLGSRPTRTRAVTASGRSHTPLLVSDLDTQPHPLARR